MSSTDIPNRGRICIVVTTATTLGALYRGQIDYLSRSGFKLTLLSAPGDEHLSLKKQGFEVVGIEMAREPSPWRDIISLTRLSWFFLRNRFDVIHVSTPKAALLGAIAARIAFQSQKVVYTVRGRAYENMRSFRRRFMAGLDFLACSLSRVVIPISRELGDALVEERICSLRKIRYIGSGSSNGIDIQRFEKTEERLRAAKQFRRDCAIPDDVKVLLYVGRFRFDKGVDELVRVASNLLNQFQGKVRLLMVGRHEDGSPCSTETIAAMQNSPYIHVKDWMDEPALAFLSADLVLMPSHREGFGNVALEAGAAGLPVIGYDIMGLREAVVHGETGLLVPLQDEAALEASIRRLIDSPELASTLGENGRLRVRVAFSQQVIWNAIADLYDEAVLENRKK